MKLSPPTGADLAAWARRLVDDLNRFFPSIEDLPEFADDQAAEAGRLKVGQGYIDPNGFVRRRRA